MMDLAGRWEILPDPEARGLRERWFEHPPAEGWVPIDVPAAWQHALGADFHGVAWYRRRVELPHDWLTDGSRIWLRFESVATDCRLWINSRAVGRHVGDYLPFQFDLTPSIFPRGPDMTPAPSPAPPVRGAGVPPVPPPPSSSLNLLVRVDEIHATRPPPGTTTEYGHITKGFHDVLSLQHGGLWGGVSLRRTGPIAFIPGGSWVLAHADGSARAIAELEPHMTGGMLEVELTDPAGTVVARAQAPIGAEHRIEVAVRVRDPVPWSPERPALHHARFRLFADARPSDEAHVRFGFRTVTTGGAGNRSILLNGQPIQLRGVLHWGHEPRHIAPAPPPEQVRAEFARLRDMGFNCVCLCMWYPPEHYFDIADETGMLIWQEHPVWKSRMEVELIPEYRRLYDGFFRRDRRHASVVVVSGACEHERIHPDLAAWWWKRAKAELPDRLAQIQTAFTSWVNPEQTDLHDEHVYESSGRWVAFLEDIQAALAELPPRPFVMGETIIGTAWPDTDGDAQSPTPRPWWRARGLDECRALERAITERFGGAALDRFRRHARRNNLLHRKFQSEVFRSYPGHAGWVMNQLRDVPAARLGFMDERDRWRFSPAETRSWLDDRVILLKTPDRNASFIGARSIACAIGVANFGPGPFVGAVTVRVADPPITLSPGVSPVPPPALSLHSPAIDCPAGGVAFVPIRIDLPRVDRPTCVRVYADARGFTTNEWDLWALPEPADPPPGVVRLDGIPFSQRDRELDFEERAYSSGWGLKVRTWTPTLPHPETVLFRCPVWRVDAPMPPGTRVVVTHKLTRRLLEWLVSGGRVLWLAAGRTPGSLPTKFVTLWGQCPLVPEGDAERWPVGPGDSDWVVDLLHHDLTRRYTRAIAVEELPIGSATVSVVDQADPIVRYVFTHDHGTPRLMDSAFVTRVGRGRLLATSLDHAGDAGRCLLDRFLRSLAGDDTICRTELDPAILHALASDV